MKILLALSLLLSAACNAQDPPIDHRCLTEASASYGGWQPMSTAPHDGTVIEMIQTFGIAPTYDLVRWDKESPFVRMHFGWPSVTKKDYGIDEECGFWRPYHGDPKHYVDPTNGFQDKAAYWCSADHMGYNKKADKCEELK